MIVKNGYQWEEEAALAEADVLAQDRELILWNDDVNTFDFVIESLVKVCSHDTLQAEQCSYIVHYNGKCAVKKGDWETLKPMCLQLLDRGLTATIN